jgi:actin-related protein
VDTRVELYQSILLTGGLAQISGMTERIQKEILDNLSIKANEASSLKEKVNVLKQIFPPSETAWIGASLIGALKFQSRVDTSKEAFDKENIVPDWTQLRT